MHLRVKAALATLAAAGVTLLGATAASAAPVSMSHHTGRNDHVRVDRHRRPDKDGRHKKSDHHGKKNDHGRHGHGKQGDHGHGRQNYTVTAVTYLAGRPDSGGGGNWAVDRIQRTLTLRPEGLCAGGYAYQASLSDQGTFLALKGQLAPNQGGTSKGSMVNRYISGRMHGFGDFTTLCASNPASGRYVPHFVYGASDPSSTWPELAFPQGTTFSVAPGENQWGYWYNARNGQHWLDAAWNQDGQAANAGNITG